jgi:hypothetical protein
MKPPKRTSVSTSRIGVLVYNHESIYRRRPMLERGLHALVLVAALTLPVSAQDAGKPKGKQDAPSNRPEQRYYVAPFGGTPWQFYEFGSGDSNFYRPDLRGLYAFNGFVDMDAGFLGVALDDVASARAKELGLDSASGALVRRVFDNSPAARAGLKDGDVIVAFDGKAVTSANGLREMLAAAKPDQVVRLEIVRDKSRQSLSATLGKRSMPALGFGDGFRDKAFGEGMLGLAFRNRARLGVSVIDLTDQLREYFGVEAGKGLLVSRVEPGSAADKAGLKAGDAIVSIGGQDVTRVGDIFRELQKLKPGSATIDVEIVRDRSRRSMSVTIEVPERDSHSTTGHFRT